MAAADLDGVKSVLWPAQTAAGIILVNPFGFFKQERRGLKPSRTRIYIAGSRVKMDRLDSLTIGLSPGRQLGPCHVGIYTDFVCTPSSPPAHEALSPTRAKSVEEL